MIERLEETLDRYEALERQMADPAVLADPARYGQLARERGGLEKVAKKFRELKQLDGEVEHAEQMLAAESEHELRELAQSELDALRPRRTKAFEDLQDLLLAGESAHYASLILEIRAGTGGDEAALFAGDLYEMYSHFAANRGWKVEVLDASPTELGGFREIVLSVSGEGAFRALQFESGGHRVQRVPETEAKGRRHTSMATVAVLPEPNEVEIQIRDEDLRIDTYRASGPGGQHVNKTSSAIRITHLPTNLVVQCQDEKSQHKNKAKAMRVLRSRLYEMKLQEEQSRRSQQRRTLIGSGDRSQRIRTYNFPENRVTDHRIGLTLYKLESIVAGNLDELIAAMTEFDRRQQLEGVGVASIQRDD